MIRVMICRYLFGGSYDKDHSMLVSIHLGGTIFLKLPMVDRR